MSPTPPPILPPTTQSTQPATQPATLPAVQPTEFFPALLFWTAATLFGLAVARFTQWRPDRLPDPETFHRPSSRDAMSLWVGAAAMFGIQLLVGIAIVRPMQIHFAGSAIGDEVTMIGLVLAYLAGFGAAAVVHRHLKWQELPTIGLARGIKLDDILLAGTAALVAIPATNVALVETQWLYQTFHYETTTVHQLLQVMDRDRQSPGVLALTVLVAVVLAPAFEELMFRGHVQMAIGRWFPRMRGVPIVATSLIFAAVHEPWSMPPIFVLSLFLGYAFERTRSLWVSILLHALFNGVSTAWFLLAGAGNG